MVADQLQRSSFPVAFFAMIAIGTTARAADLPYSPLLEPNAQVISVLEGPAPAVQGSGATKQSLDLSSLKWTVAGFVPNLWQLTWRNEGAWKLSEADVPPVPMQVPGSVQAALLAAKVIPDWNLPLQSRESEWVENRHWICHAEIPDAWIKPKAEFRLECLGLDYAGWIIVNNKEIGRFRGTHLPYGLDLTKVLKPKGNTIDIVFDLSPRWLGQFGLTSKMTEWKARYNYTWDWVPRLVQIGIWDDIRLVATTGPHIEALQCATDADPKSSKGWLETTIAIGGSREGSVRLTLEKDGQVVRTADIPAERLGQKIVWEDLPIELWWPNLEGAQPLYTVSCRLLNAQGHEVDAAQRRVGFKHVAWQKCEGAPKADPWICVVNGRPTFLQGVNFTPIRAMFADVPRAEYEKRLKAYRDLGCNILRVNGCGFLEKECFYDLCDELGLMVWQDFPLSSSGVDNWAPEDEASIKELSVIAKSYIQRRRHHASLMIWCGGNELQGDLNGRKCDSGKPCGLDHPLLAQFGKITKELDPQRHYLVTTPSGPRSWWTPDDHGKGVCWDVHGPYNREADKYWKLDDALFRTEVGCPGAAPIEQIEKYAGKFKPLPATVENPYWNHPTCWWVDWQLLVNEHGRAPKDLAEYVAWSQRRQAEALCQGVKACKDRFPRCGGVLLWCGHDTFPIPINTSILDYEGKPKPAATALSRIWREPPPHAKDAAK
ncbi:MAG: glycoside hydrolase family 2 TIM barrel-domain containing protein [Thermoguttaceae bacterium]